MMNSAADIVAAGGIGGALAPLALIGLVVGLIIVCGLLFMLVLMVIKDARERRRARRQIMNAPSTDGDVGFNRWKR